MGKNQDGNIALVTLQKKWKTYKGLVLARKQNDPRVRRAFFKRYVMCDNIFIFFFV